MIEFEDSEDFRNANARSTMLSGCSEISSLMAVSSALGTCRVAS